MPNSHSIVLVVEDEKDLRCLISEIVEECGFQTVQAQNGEEALAILDKHDVAAIVSDLNMPRMDGLTLLETIKSRRSTTPFILLTGFWSKESGLRALRLGAFDFLDKPFEAEVLQNIVRNAVALRLEQIKAVEGLQEKFLEKGIAPESLKLGEIETLADMIAKRRIG